MPLFTAGGKHRRRDSLVSTLISVPCRICAAPAAIGCDYWAETGDDLIQLSRDPLLFTHATRLTDALNAHPAMRLLAMAQFEEGAAPAVLTGGT